MTPTLQLLLIVRRSWDAFPLRRYHRLGGMCCPAAATAPPLPAPLLLPPHHCPALPPETGLPRRCTHPTIAALPPCPLLPPPQARTPQLHAGAGSNVHLKSVSLWSGTQTTTHNLQGCEGQAGGHQQVALPASSQTQHNSSRAPVPYSTVCAICARESQTV